MIMKMDFSNCSAQQQELEKINKSLEKMQFRIEFMRIRGLLWNPTGMEKTMKEISRMVEEEQENTKLLSNSIAEVQKKYRINENAVNDYLVSHGEGKNIAFDDRGRYGGDQGALVDIKKTDPRYDTIKDIIQNYYPDYSDKDIQKFLKKLNSEGCGYVALINTIFNQYAGKADEFEKAFGFPMYDEDGDLNYDLLMVDFYSAMDNHHSIDGKDVYVATEDYSKTKGYGTTADTRKYRWEKYLGDRGINVSVDAVNVTPENYNEISQKGEIIIAIHPVILYDEAGNRVEASGGHAMTITEVTEDGWYKVSTWGQDCYYVNPNESYDRISYQQVLY